jgi:hypothetical protein
MTADQIKTLRREFVVGVLRLLVTGDTERVRAVLDEIEQIKLPPPFVPERTDVLLAEVQKLNSTLGLIHFGDKQLELARLAAVLSLPPVRSTEPMTLKNPHPKIPGGREVIEAIETWAAAQGLVCRNISKTVYVLDVPGAPLDRERPSWLVRFRGDWPFEEPPTVWLALVVNSRVVSPPEQILRAVEFISAPGTDTEHPIADLPGIIAELERVLPLAQKAWADWEAKQ